MLNAQLNAPLEGSGRASGQAAGTFLAATQGIFSQGQIEKSEYAWNMAIEGDGFFQIQQPDGTITYTRDGSFRLDGEGRLTTANGSFLYPNVIIPMETSNEMLGLANQLR